MIQYCNISVLSVNKWYKPESNITILWLDEARNVTVKWTCFNLLERSNKCAPVASLQLLGNLFLHSKIRNFLSFNVHRTRIVNKNKQKTQDVDGMGVNVWANGLQIMRRLFSLKISQPFFLFLIWTFVLCVTAGFTVEIMDSMERLDVCLIRPEQAEELPECVTWTTGDHGERWGGVTQQRRQVERVSVCVCLTNSPWKTPGWR